MGLDNVETHTGRRGEVRTGNLPDGTKVTVRPSADRRPTIEITDPKQGDKAVRGGVKEIRYGDKSPRIKYGASYAETKKTIVFRVSIVEKIYS